MRILLRNEKEQTNDGQGRAGVPRDDVDVRIE